MDLKGSYIPVTEPAKGRKIYLNYYMFEFSNKIKRGKQLKESNFVQVKGKLNCRPYKLFSKFHSNLPKL